MSFITINPEQVHVCSSPELAADLLVGNMIKQTRQQIHEKERCVWALSGGNSIYKIYDALLEHKDDFEKIADSLTVTWVDERFVPHSHPESNFGNAKKYFWKYFENVHLLPVPYLQTLQESVEKFRNLLEENGIKRRDIDVTLLGMGNDGHTASLFPNHKALNEKDADIISVQYPSVNLPRVTMTYGLINSSKNLLTYAYGREKGVTFRMMLKSGNKSEFPFLGIRKENHDIYTDSDFFEKLNTMLGR